MIRFVDITEDYGDVPPCCAFLCTSTDTFLTNPVMDSHVFDCREDVEEHKMADRLLSLVPKDFFYHDTAAEDCPACGTEEICPRCGERRDTYDDTY